MSSYFDAKFFNLCELSPRKFTFYLQISIYTILYSGESVEIHFAFKKQNKNQQYSNRILIIVTFWTILDCCHVAIA